MSGNEYLKGLALWAALLPVAVSTVSAAEVAATDEIVLKNGSRVLGTVTGSRGGAVSIDTDFAGSLSISVDQIASMQTRSPVTMKLADDTVIRDQPLQIDNEQLVVSGTAPAQTYALSELLLVNPEPWELGEGYHWTGLVSLAWAMQRGNTESDELDYKLQSIWRSQQDRYTLNLSGEQDEANDEKNADNWNITGKYDYFISGPTYVGVNAFAEQDKFADLDLRYFIGPYVGREFYIEPIFSFAAEVGLSYVNENFITAEDQDYPGANWNLRMSSNYLADNSLLYMDQLGIWNLDETSDVIVNTTFGLSFPLLWQFEAAAEILLEYDAGAVEGVDDMDQTYRFRIGYTW